MQSAIHAPHTPVRADGIQARSRLVSAGLRLFANKGFRQTSIREVAQAAQVNLAAISYYFGDKAGLYKAVFSAPISGETCAPPDLDRTDLDLGERLLMFYRQFLEPLKFGEELRLLVKLHYREMIEPTGVWQETIDTEIRPSHDAMLRMLVRELGLRRADHDVQRLALCMIGMAVHFFACQPVVEAIAPQVVTNSKSVDLLASRMAVYALAMVNAERDRRAALETDHG